MYVRRQEAEPCSYGYRPDGRTGEERPAAIHRRDEYDGGDRLHLEVGAEGRQVSEDGDAETMNFRPCQYCKKREVGCHDKCKDYQLYKKEYEAVKNFLAPSEGDRYIAEQKRKNRKK